MIEEYLTQYLWVNSIQATVFGIGSLFIFILMIQIMKAFKAARNNMSYDDLAYLMLFVLMSLILGVVLIEFINSSSNIVKVKTAPNIVFQEWAVQNDIPTFEEDLRTLEVPYPALEHKNESETF